MVLVGSSGRKKGYQLPDNHMYKAVVHFLTAIFLLHIALKVQIYTQNIRFGGVNSMPDIMKIEVLEFYFPLETKKRTKGSRKMFSEFCYDIDCVSLGSKLLLPVSDF